MPFDDVTFDLPFALGAVLLAGVVIYALTGGADFGGGAVTVFPEECGGFGKPAVISGLVLKPVLDLVWLPVILVMAGVAVAVIGDFLPVFGVNPLEVTFGAHGDDFAGREPGNGGGRWAYVVVMASGEAEFVGDVA